MVSVCALQDIGAWRATAPRVLERIESEEYLLICPDAQIPDFTRATPGPWRIAGDDAFCGGYGFKRVESLVTGFNKRNVGHLFQQFLKINALIDPVLRDEDLVLIWDADTVPLRKIRFTDPATGKIGYYSGVEHHPPYFQTLQKLTGLGKVVGPSFIAQCFPTKVKWAREFVEAVSGGSYIQVCLDSLPGLDPQSQEFSEYEMMGTWNFVKHPEAVALKTRNRWTRHGSRLVGSELKGPWTGLFLFFLSFLYDFAAFEKWEERLSPGRLLAGALRKAFKTRKG